MKFSTLRIDCKFISPKVQTTLWFLVQSDSQKAALKKHQDIFQNIIEKQMLSNVRSENEKISALKTGAILKRKTGCQNTVLWAKQRQLTGRFHPVTQFWWSTIIFHWIEEKLPTIHHFYRTWHKQKSIVINLAGIFQNIIILHDNFLK